MALRKVSSSPDKLKKLMNNIVGGKLYKSVGQVHSAFGHSVEPGAAKPGRRLPEERKIGESSLAYSCLALTTLTLIRARDQRTARAVCGLNIPPPEGSKMGEKVIGLLMYYILQGHV